MRFRIRLFARPDTRCLHAERPPRQSSNGTFLAKQAPVEADVVMGVPESGIPAAEGYAKEIKIPYAQGLVKNRYIGRTFIALIRNFVRWVSE